MHEFIFIFSEWISDTNNFVLALPRREKELLHLLSFLLLLKINEIEKIATLYHEGGVKNNYPQSKLLIGDNNK